jgi:hypothetical protein
VEPWRSLPGLRNIGDLQYFAETEIARYRESMDQWLHQLKRLPLYHIFDSMFVRAGTAPVLFLWDDTRWRQNVVELNASWKKKELIVLFYSVDLEGRLQGVNIERIEASCCVFLMY